METSMRYYVINEADGRAHEALLQDDFGEPAPKDRATHCVILIDGLFILTEIESPDVIFTVH